MCALSFFLPLLLLRGWRIVFCFVLFRFRHFVCWFFIHFHTRFVLTKSSLLKPLMDRIFVVDVVSSMVDVVDVGFHETDTVAGIGIAVADVDADYPCNRKMMMLTACRCC